VKEKKIPVDTLCIMGFSVIVKAVCVVMSHWSIQVIGAETDNSGDIQVGVQMYELADRFGMKALKAHENEMSGRRRKSRGHKKT